MQHTNHSDLCNADQILKTQPDPDYNFLSKIFWKWYESLVTCLIRLLMLPEIDRTHLIFLIEMNPESSTIMFIALGFSSQKYSFSLTLLL